MKEAYVHVVVMMSVILVLGFLGTLEVSSEASPTRATGTVDLVPDPQDEISPTGSPVKHGTPGSDVTFTIWIRNTHPSEQRVVLNILEGPDWLISARGSVDVEPNSSESATIIASIPDTILDPNDNYAILVEGTGNLTGDSDSLLLLITIDITIDHELLLSPYNTDRRTFQVYPGEKTFVDVTLSNLGNMNARFEMTIQDNPLGWDAQFREGEEVLSFHLGHGETDSEYRTRIMVTVPASSTPGELLELTVISKSLDSEEFSAGKMSDSIVIGFEVVKGSTITISPLQTLVRGEDYVDVTYRIHHSGVVDSLVEPLPSVFREGKIQQGWDFLISPAGKILVKIGETREMTVRVTAPEEAFGYFDLLMDAASSSADVISGESVIYFLPRSDITISELTGGPFDQGDDVVLQTIVANNGDLPTQGLVTISGVPAGYSFEVDPSVDLSLDPGETVPLTLNIHSMEEVLYEPFDVTVSIHAPMDDGSGQWASVAETTRRIDYRPLPDLEVRRVYLSRDLVYEGEEIFINVTVANIGNIPAGGVEVLIYEIAFQLSNKLIATNSTSLAPGDIETISFRWTAKVYTKSIRAIVKTPSGMEDMDPEDNEMRVDVYVERHDNRLPTEKEDDGIFTPETAAAGGMGLGIFGAVLIFFGYQDIVRYPFWVAVTPLYSKLRPEHLLNNRLRKRIYVYVQNHPGEHFRSILTHLNLTNGTLAHHLYTLEKENLIRSQRDGLYRRFYPAGYQIDQGQVSLTSIQQRIVDLIKERPGLSQKEISQRLELSNSTVNYNIKSLKDKGLIEVRKEGKSTSIYPSQDLNS
ncbi:MAG: winged helix-turn-helix transcriptional regulator [Thermoplasmatota archaeon]